MVPLFSALALIKAVGLQYSNLVPWRSCLCSLQPIENNCHTYQPQDIAREHLFTYRDVLVIGIHNLHYVCLNQVWFSWASQLVGVGTYFGSVLTVHQDINVPWISLEQTQTATQEGSSNNESSNLAPKGPGL